MDITLHTEQHFIAQLRALHQKGLFRQELNLAEKTWGPYSQWRKPHQLIVGGNIFVNLGLKRIADAMRLHAWRKQRSNPESIYYYATVIYSRRGPLEALKLFERYNELVETNTSIRPKWLALKASIYSQYRDWETAHSLITQAQQLSPNHPVIQLEAAYLLEAEDRYAQASAAILPLTRQMYRPAIQFAAHLKTLEDDKEGAIELLRPHMESMESLGICLQLFRLYQQSDQMVNAEHCVTRAKQLLPQGRNILSQEFAGISFELAYYNKQYDSAVNFLKESKSPFYLRVRENIEKSDKKKEAVLLDVPFVRQHHMTCAPATLTSIVQYWGQAADHLDIVEDICYDGTPYQAEREWAENQGWIVKEFDLQPEIAFSLIDREVPFTLSTVSPGSAHLQAIIGYDPIQGVYLVRDPYYPSVQDFLIDELSTHGKSFGPRCMVLVPNDKQHLIEGLEFPAAVFYDLNFSLLKLLNLHQRDDALNCLEQMQEHDSNHRLTLLGTRSLARYDNDYISELSCVDRLLEASPEDLNLQAEKSSLLGNLGRHQQQIDYLKEKTQQPDAHPYIVETLANCIRGDKRKAEYNAGLLSYVLYRQPTNAFALWMLAGSLWDQEKRQKAFELYRLCACLEDKNEAYIEAYFIAARYLKQQDQALTDLQKRVTKLGKKSFNPYESLFFAYRTLNKDQAAIDTLLEAKQYHHKNEVLTKRLIEIYLANGMVEEAQDTLKESSGNLAVVDNLDLKAAIASYNNDWEKEKEFYENLLVHNPLHYKTIEALTNLLAHHQDEDSAVYFVESRLALNPTDPSLLFLKQEWLFRKPNEEQEKFARRIISIHEHNSQAHIQLALVLSNQAQEIANGPMQDTLLKRRDSKLKEAITAATTAYQINPLNTENLLTLGDLYRRNEDNDIAKKYYKEAIRYAVDTDDAFPRLLVCDDKMQSKRESLSFIYEQLMTQTSYGNGILEYLNVARDLVKDEELLAFLKEAVRLRPDLWQSWTALAIHLGAMDQLTTALETVSNGIKRFPFIPRLLLERACLFYSAQDFNSAEDDLRNALQISPQWLRAITLLADVYESQDRIDEALELVNAALNHSPKSSNLYGYLADYHIMQSEHKKARSSLEKALSLDPHYEWAWDKYSEISHSLNLPDATVMLARSLRKQHPNSAFLWKILAEQESETNKKISCIDQAIKMYPKNEDFNLAKCQILFAENRLSELTDFVYDSKWDGYPPPALLTFEAWADAKYQRYDKAIEKINNVVQTYPYYYDGWRLLTQWLKETGEYSEALKQVRNCVRLSPHNPAALTLAAETAIDADNHEIEISKPEVNQWLKKAVIFNPKDDYNNLTWLDFLIESKQVEALIEALEIVQYDQSNPYYKVRILQSALLQETEAQATQLFSELLQDPVQSEWVFDTSYEALINAGLKDKTYELMRSALNESTVNPFVGKIWLRFAFDQRLAPKEIFDFLSIVESNSKLWNEAMEEVFTPSHYGKVTIKVIRRFGKKLQDDGRLWSIVTFYLANQQKWTQLCNWCKHQWDKPNRNAWAVYFYSYGLRLKNEWEKAAEVNETASSLPSDDYIDRILLWQLVDGAIYSNRNIALDDIGRIRIPELAALEAYVFELLQVMWHVQNNGLQPTADKVQSLLVNAKHSHQDLLQAKVTNSIKRRVRQFLYRHIQGGLWQKIIWRIRLFNMM